MCPTGALAGSRSSGACKQTSHSRPQGPGSHLFHLLCKDLPLAPVLSAAAETLLLSLLFLLVLLLLLAVQMEPLDMQENTTSFPGRPIGAVKLAPGSATRPKLL